MKWDVYLKNNMNTIDIEDIVTIVCSEFLRQEKYLTSLNKFSGRIPYLQMNMAARGRVSRRLIDNFMKRYKNYKE